MAGRIELARCDHTWQETLALWTHLLAGPVRRIPIFDGLDALAFNQGRWALTELLKRACGDRDEVVMPSFLCPAVPEAVLRAGKRPRFVDIGPDLNMDIAATDIGDRTAAVIVPHMYGAPAAISELEARCRERGALLIDDAASATGIRCGNRRLGSFGDAGLYSFDQQKSLTAGKGGLLLCNSDRARDAMAGLEVPSPSRITGAREALWWQWADRRHHRMPLLRYYASRMREKLGMRRAYTGGTLAAMPGVHAAVLRVQLRRMDEILQRRAHNCRGLHERLRDIGGLEIPQYSEGCMLTRFMVRTPGHRWQEQNGTEYRDHPLARHLSERGIGHARPYFPLHQHRDFQEHARGALPRTEETIPELVALPIQGKLTEAQLDRVAEFVRLFAAG